MITLARWEWFEQWQAERVKKRGDDYESFKSAIGERIWRQVLAMYPQLEDKVRLSCVPDVMSRLFMIITPRTGSTVVSKRFMTVYC